MGAGVALAALLAISYLQFRHLALALIVVIAPLPGAILANWLQVPGPAPAYLCGFFIANILASQIVAKVCDGEKVSQAAGHASRDAFPFLIWPAILVVCTSAVVPVLLRNASGLMIAGCIVLSSLFAFVLPVGARIPGYGGEFVTHANRTRETWDRGLNWLAFIVQPRWGWSVSGIGLVFAVLGLFSGHPNGQSMPFDVWVLGVTAALFVTITCLATRDLRRMIAFCLTAAVLFCFARWMDQGRMLAGGDFWLALALAALPALAVAARSAAFARDGDNAAVATLRSFDVFAAPISFFCLGAAVVMVVLGLVLEAILVLCGSLVALLVFPALTAAIFDLFPPRVSLDAYRVR
jgi:hypothetical protein